MSKRVTIIGGGVIGLAAAWYCRKQGFDVTVIDRGDSSRNGCSYGNAGMIVPSHFVPLAAPGMIRLGLKWMLSSQSPFYIRPRLSMELLGWLLKFRSACSKKRVAAAAPLLRDLHLRSRSCYAALESEWALNGESDNGFGLIEKGLVMLCRTEEALEEEAHVAELSNKLGIPAEVLDSTALARLDPNIEMSAYGGVYFPKDCHLSPNRLMDGLQTRLEDSGCEFVWNAEVTGLRENGGVVEAVATTEGDIESDEFVVSGGVWSSELLRQCGLSLPMQAGKGYSLTLSQPAQLPTVCSILTEARVAVTPIGTALRFGGTMEIVGNDESISDSRVKGIIHSVSDYYPRFSPNDFAGLTPWVGLRPCSPDGLPYLGRTRRFKNLIVSTGHAMMGISLALVSGQMVADLVDHKPIEGIDGLGLMSPDRY